MNTLRAIIVTAFALLVLIAGNPAKAHAQSISVTNVKPSGAVNSGGLYTITADVTVTNLPDGVYNVSLDCTGDQRDTADTTTVSISNGKGTVSKSMRIGRGASTTTGTIEVTVTFGVNVNTGTSDVKYN